MSGPTAAARRAAVALFGKPGDSGFDEEWLAKRAAIIDRETGLPELLEILKEWFYGDCAGIFPDRDATRAAVGRASAAIAKIEGRR